MREAHGEPQQDWGGHLGTLAPRVEQSQHGQALGTGSPSSSPAPLPTAYATVNKQIKIAKNDAE